VEQVEVDTTKRIILQVVNVLAILGVPVSSGITYAIFPSLDE